MCLWRACTATALIFGKSWPNANHLNMRGNGGAFEELFIRAQPCRRQYNDTASWVVPSFTMEMRPQMSFSSAGVLNRPLRIDDRQLKILARSITGVCHGHSGVGRFDGFFFFFTI